MKNKFNANNLYVGKIMYISNEKGGPFYHETDLKYIFEAKNLKQKFYEEIFTNTKIQRESATYEDGFECKNFNTPYIINLESYLNYFPDEIYTQIGAKSMLLKMDEINGSNKSKDYKSEESLKY